MMCIVRFFLLLIIFLISNNFPQATQLRLRSLSTDVVKNNSSIIQTETNHIYNTLITKDSILAFDINLSELIDVIVEFRDKPLFLEQEGKSLQKKVLYTYQQTQTMFNNDIMQIFNKANSKLNKKLLKPEKKREFYKIFNGASYRVPRILIPEITNLPYIKKVHNDKVFHTEAIAASGFGGNISMIGADSVWYSYHNQGDSIVVGVLDTGIDYLHNALGKGFGAGFKVIGGYDFVNKDDDPMDDHGHGTHVAGIVAANSDSIKGVAPEAFLMAFKVLDNSGKGTESNVIAGVERAVDPNGDDDYKDKVDIANMSLGSSAGDPDDALSTAITNAESLGVVFCVAAGNGRDDFSIESPGAAPSAITVGAIDNWYHLAGFSSRGPVRFSFAMKPDVMAPGVSIISTVPNDKYATYSGTSMATAHATGVCALIKYMHRDWTPKMIKSAIMGSARDLGYEPMNQGCGLINAMKAVSLSTLVIPSYLSFGIDNSEENLWTKKDTIVIYNRSENFQKYNVSVLSLIPGMSLTAFPGSFSLQSGESQKIVFSLSVLNNVVPFSKTASRTYYGKIQINGDKDKIQLPWTFVKSSIVLIEYDGSPYNGLPYNYLLYNNENLFTGIDGWHLAEKTYIEQLILPGIYNLFFIMYDQIGEQHLRFISREKIEINGFKKINVSAREADKIIKFSGVDESGNNISDSLNIESSIGFVFNNNSNTIISDYYLIPGTSTCYTSGFSNEIIMFAGIFQNTIPEDNKIRVIQFPVQKGLNSNVLLKNNPVDLIKEGVDIFDYMNNQNYYASFYNVMRYKIGERSEILGYLNSDRFINSNLWKGILFMNADPDKDYGYSTSIRTGVNNTATIGYETDIFRAKADSIGWFSSEENPDYFFIPKNKSLLFGDGSIYPLISIVIDKSNNYKTEIKSKLLGQLREKRFSDQALSNHYLMDENNTKIQECFVSDALNVNLMASKYKYVIRDIHYRVWGMPGSLTSTSTFDLSKGIAAPPTLTSLRVFDSQGIPTNSLKINEKGKIYFSVNSSLTGNNLQNYDLAQIKLFVKADEVIGWKELKTQMLLKDPLTGFSFSSEVSDVFNDVEAAKVDLRIYAADKEGNSTELRLEPSFIIGNYYATNIDSQPILTNIPKTYTLHSNYPNPFNYLTLIRYDLPKSSNVKIEVFDILGHKISSLIDEQQDAGSHKIYFDGRQLSSGIYIIRMNAEGHLFQKKTILLK